MSSDDACSTPRHWSPSIKFTKDLAYSPAISADLKKQLHTPCARNAGWPKVGRSSLSPPCQIQPIRQPGHPADGQHGLFATTRLSPSSFILPYIGLVHSNADDDTDQESNYDLSLDRELGLSIDASSIGNEARYINDYRGIAEAPNAEFQDCWVQLTCPRDSTRKWERRIGIFVLSVGKAGKRSAGIAPGEEILVNYGRSFWAERKQNRQE